jgi:MFS superfamily sulfate permease-like transporter
MWQMSRTEFGLAVAAFLGVALVGVLEGVLVAIGLSFVTVVARAWQPYRTELVQVAEKPGFHDIERHPGGQRIPGMVLVRFDAPLFFANGDIFDNYVRSVVAASTTPVSWVIVAAEPLTGLDTTAVDELVDLDTYLDGKGIRLVFAEMKGPIKDRLIRFGLGDRFGPERFYPTVESAVAAFGDGETPDQ